jgi:predicted amidohydrolase
LAKSGLGPAYQLRAALAQYPSDRDCAEIVAEAKAAAAEIVVFPEMYSNNYARFDPDDVVAEARWRAGAESLDGDFVGRFRQAARKHRIHVVLLRSFGWGIRALHRLTTATMVPSSPPAP